MKRIIILVVLLVIGIGASIGLILHSELQPKFVPPTDEDGEPMVEGNGFNISFSEKDTFYDERINVEITTGNDATVYYTLDGATPDKDATKYTEPIAIAAGDEVMATTIKVIAYDSENNASDVVTKSYVTGENIYKRFDKNTLVFVLSSDPYNLYDYNYGVCVEGAMRDEYLASDEYDGGEIPYNAPANWYMTGRESERDMYVEVYDNEGNQIINQAAGGRVVGGYSRATSQKSWRLIARNEYSEGNGTFKYNFFAGATDAYGQLLTKYDRITLRNNANDREFASIRDEVANELAQQAGFPDTQETRPAAVFLNGEYYGFSWLHEAYSESYLESTYGGNKDNFAIVEGKEQEAEADTEEIQKDYDYLLELAEGGLTDDAKFEEFCSLVDIDNLMLYYAIEVYIDNKDWPGNNFKVWRYYPSEDEEVTSEYLDGKWRFLMFDVEYAMGLYGAGYSDKTLTAVLDGTHMQGDSLFLKALLERDDMKEYFSNTICDLISGAFSPDNFKSVIEDKINECDTECMYALENGYTSEWASPDSFEESRQQIKAFAVKRPNVMYKNLMSQFGIEDETKYNITVNNVNGVKTTLNSQVLTEAGSLSVDYFSAYGVNVTAEAYDNYEFDHFDVNGKTYTEPTIRLTSDMAKDGKIEVTVVAKKISTGNIYISEVFTASDNGDWIELYNPGDSAYSTENLYLSDDETELNKWKIPTTKIPSNSTLVIVCKNNTASSALLKLQTNFSLKTGETLFLSDKSGSIICKVGITDVDDDVSIIRQSDGSYSEGTPTMGEHKE